LQTIILNKKINRSLHLFYYSSSTIKTNVPGSFVSTDPVLTAAILECSKNTPKNDQQPGISAT
jgi:hypothetical protein